MKIADEIGFETGYIVGLFVHPDDTGQFFHQAFDQVFGFVFGIGLEVENQHVLPAKTLAARIYELRGSEKNFDARLVFLFLVFSLLFGLFRFFLFFLALFLDFFDALLRLLVFLLLFASAQVLAVLLHKRGDLLSFAIEKREFLAFFLFHLPCF